MAHNTRVRPGGLWAIGSALLATEMEQIDSTLSRCINGDQGGVWAPTSVIEIGGEGLKVTGQCALYTVTISSTLDVQEQVTCLAGLSVELGITCGALQTIGGDATLDGDLYAHNASISQTLAVSGATQLASCEVGGALACLSTLSVAGNLSVDGASTLAGAVQVGGVCTLAGGVHITGDSTLTKPLVPSGAGRVPNRLATIVSDGDKSFRVDQVGMVRIPAGVLTANRIYNLLPDGAVEGDEILLFSEDGTNLVTVRDYAGGTVVSGLKVTTSGTPYSVRAVFSQGHWYRAATSLYVAAS